MSTTPTTFYDLKAELPGGQIYEFSQLKDKVVLIVNTASGCGFATQFTGLQALYDKYKDQGFVVLGFPSNQFGKQEPLDDAAIGEFCTLNHGVTFPLMRKSDVNGDNTNEVFRWLKNEKAGLLGLSRIKWNFEKFLVDKSGNVVNRWVTVTAPEAMDPEIAKLLNHNPQFSDISDRATGIPQTTMMSESVSELKVTFFPPLYLQRRIWILDTIRHRQIRSVLDVGCGEGELLGALRQPAPWLPSHPHLTDDGKDDFVNIHMAYIAGLDISDDVKYASQAVAPLAPEIRWEHLEAKIWKGRLEDPNPEFVNFDCVVASEVIEHLEEHVLEDFMPMILGMYHPRFLLLTTPSYTFNARFTAPDAPSTARSGYPDPTGRTTRIFRHDDHKFEWTVQEFEQWCHAEGEKWGYAVDISSVGMALEVDEWGRDEELGGASQVAEFRRLDDEESVKRREVKEKVSEEGTKHELFAHHSHPAHPRSQQPGTLQEIGNAVKAKLEASRETFSRFEEIWFDPNISTLCGGWIELLSKAVEEDDQLELHRKGAIKRSNWQIGLIGGILELQNLWLEEEENSLDYIPPDFCPEEEELDSASSGIDGDVSATSSDEGEEDSGRSEDSERSQGRRGDGDQIDETAPWDLEGSDST